MSESPAIQLRNVTKVYKLYGSQRDQFVDVIGLTRLGFRLHQPVKDFAALNDISLEVPHGQRIGIVGRNGAGKTTLLKLISGNFAPTTGEVAVNGRLQALMSAGLGFHPEFTGRENIHASLKYNDLTPSEYQEAVDDVIRFCELGDFLDQPYKSYSLGMQSRLQFACATSIRPDILVVDEVLGAGDVYFSVKSSARMERLAKSGATLILVSHSMQQVLQFCERVIWIDDGKIVRDGDARTVVTEYEKFMFNLSRGSRQRSQVDLEQTLVEQSEQFPEIGDDEQPIEESEADAETMPDWYCDRLSSEMAGQLVEEDVEVPEEASRWVNDERLKIVGSRLIGSDGKQAKRFLTHSPFAVEILIEATESGTFDCWYVVLIYGEDGKPLTRHVSRKQRYSLKAGERRRAFMFHDELLFGEGEYHVSVGIFKHWDPNERHVANWYEILNRSLTFKVYKDGEFDPSLFYHPHKWLHPDDPSKAREFK